MGVVQEEPSQVAPTAGGTAVQPVSSLARQLPLEHAIGLGWGDLAFAPVDRAPDPLGVASHLGMGPPSSELMKFKSE